MILVNGYVALTARSQQDAADKSHITDYLSESEILVRIFNASSSETANKIAEYTNSQNSISNVDLKSLRILAKLNGYSGGT
ncbi:hypothetical protein IRP70_005013 [Salmonella enterica]|nr:hypothetical protein [Salmonella enterica]EGM2983855.1 hypothetical protein [Salmonella enterica]